MEGLRRGEESPEDHEDLVDVPLLNLLFGIEIEFLAALPPDTIPEWNNQDAIDELSVTLEMRGLDHEKPGSTHDLVQDRFPKVFVPDNPVEDWRLRALELISPPEPAPSLATAPYTQPGWLLGLAPYFEALTSHNDLTNPEHLTYISDTCGFHIHIGLPDNQALSLPLLKHLAILTLMCEPVLSSLHPISRTPYARSHARKYCRSNRTAFRPDMHSCKDESLGVLDFKRRVMQCENINQLAWLMGSPYPLGDNLQKLPDNSIPKTLEEQAAQVLGASRCDWVRDPGYKLIAYYDAADIDELASFANSKPNDGVLHDAEADIDSDSDSDLSSIVTDDDDVTTLLGMLNKEDLASKRNPPPQLTRTLATPTSPYGLPEAPEAIPEIVYPYGDKYKIVRWNLLPLPDDGKHTIEFRQPGGTLDSERAAFNVQLYVALVRAAERRANLEATGQEPEVDEEQGTLDGLLAVLRLCPESEAHWRTEATFMEKWRRRINKMSAIPVGKCEACARDEVRREGRPLRRRIARELMGDWHGTSSSSG